MRFIYTVLTIRYSFSYSSNQSKKSSPGALSVYSLVATSDLRSSRGIPEEK